MTSFFARSPVKLSDILMGRLLVGADVLVRHHWLRRLEKFINSLGNKLFRNIHQQPLEEGGATSPDAGRPAPLRPVPGHHLVAAMGLPPGDGVYLLPKD